MTQINASESPSNNAPFRSPPEKVHDLHNHMHKELQELREEITRPERLAVSSHQIKAQKFKVRGSNPRTAAYCHLNMPLYGSNLQGLGRFDQIEFLKTGRSELTVRPPQEVRTGMFWQFDPSRFLFFEG